MSNDPLDSPAKEQRGIDHLVLPVHDLEAAAAFYRRLGFTTTPKAIHPFGTGNILVQLKGNFLELLSVIDPEKITTPAAGGISFGDFNRRFLERREGFSMLVFESSDARADQAAFAAAGLETYPPFDFQRDAKLPNGEVVTVAFSLAFVTEPRMPEAVFFTCQQHAPQFFWKPEYQEHANGAEICSDVFLAADRPEDLAPLFEGLHSGRALRWSGDSFQVETARGRVTVLSPGTFGTRFPQEDFLDLTRGPILAGYQIKVASLEGIEHRLQQQSIPYGKNGRRLYLTARSSFGVTIEFVAAQEV